MRITIIEGMTTVQICQNEQAATMEGQEPEEVEHGYQYDYNEWTAPTAEVDTEMIKKNPVKYLDYTPEPELSDREKVEKALANSELAVILAGGEV